MITLSGVCYLEMADLERAGVSRRYVTLARIRGSRGWDITKHPADKRRLLVRYDTLKENVRARVDAALGSKPAQDLRNALVVAQQDVADLRELALEDGSRLPDEHVQRLATACAWLRLLDTITQARLQLLGFAGFAEFHQAVLECIKVDRVALPSTYAKLRARLREWKQNGVAALVGRRWCNTNSRKIDGPVEQWLIAQYAQPTKPDTAYLASTYSAIALERGWPVLTERGIREHLHRADVKPLWYLGRHGEKPWRNAFGHTMSLRGASHRDALWCSDGTKLNYFYRTDKGVAASVQMYVVMDVYAEAILGWSLGLSENFSMQYKAFEMALKLAQAKPAQLLYDGQGGHRKGDTQDFFTRASALHFPARPYNAQAKPVEALLGRYQKQVMRERWYSTGQNITAKRLDSRPNMEFILAHTKDLPTMEQLPAIMQQDVDRWNSMAHPKLGEPRMQCYTNSTNPHHVPLGFMDMVDLFWYTTQRPVAYTRQGLQLEVSGHRMRFEVYGVSGLPDEDFLRKWTNYRFLVKYDPNELDRVLLYSQDASGTRYVATARRKHTYARAVVDLRPGEAAEIRATIAVRDRQLATVAAELQTLRTAAGVDPETLVERAPYGGVKDEVHTAETTLETNITPEDEDDNTSLIDRL